MNFPKREELLFRTVQASRGISGILEALPEFISDNTVHYLPVLQVAWIFPILTVFQQDQLQNISETIFWNFKHLIAGVGPFLDIV